MIWLYILYAIIYIGSRFWFYCSGWNRGYNECQEVSMIIVNSYKDEIMKLEEKNYELSNKESE